MISKLGKNSRKLVIIICIAMISTGVLSIYRDAVVDYRMAGVVGPLSDGLFITGVMFLGIGILLVLTNMVSFYPFRYLIYTMKRDPKVDGYERKDFYSYCFDIKEENRINKIFPTGWMILLVGVAFIVIGVAFTNIFYVV